MTNYIAPYDLLLKLPSLRAIKYFVVAARYLSFTRAAEALCVTQAAVSRQIRELEAALEVKLFNRVGRTVELTKAGEVFYETAFLSYVNIARSAERVRRKEPSKSILTICCSPAFATLWLAPRLPSFVADNIDIDIDIVCTSDFSHFEQDFVPDVVINKSGMPRSGYRMEPLFHDVIYPVCTPTYLERNPAITSIDKLKEAALLNISPYGRAQVAEHVGWSVWFELLSIDEPQANFQEYHHFRTNDYVMLVGMALDHQGVTLGWDHLVSQLIDDGRLIRPVSESLVMSEARHFLFTLTSGENGEPLSRLSDWLATCLSANPLVNSAE